MESKLRTTFALSEVAIPDLVLPGFLLMASAISVALIAATAGTAVLDQAGPVNQTLHLHTYPAFNDEIIPQLAGGVVRAISPVSSVNTTFRILSALAYLGSAALLSTALLQTQVWRAGLMVLLVASGYPILWLSSELIAGALLCLAIWLVVTERLPILIGVSLGLLALTKSELVLASLAVSVMAIARRRETAPGLIVGFLLTVGILIAPGIYVHGPHAFFASRSWSAFGQHYAAIIANFQVGPHPDPWVYWQDYMNVEFPGLNSVIDVVRFYPIKYTLFVGMSIVTGAWGAWTAFSLVLVAIAVRVARRSPGLRPVERWLLAAMIVLVPQVLISFPHIRYMARLAPLVLMVPLAELEARRDRWAFLTIALLVGYTVLSVTDRVNHMSPSPAGWFPD